MSFAHIATSTPGTGFSFGSTNPPQPVGFNFGATTATTKPSFAFAAPGSSTTASMFNTPSTNPPAYGTQTGNIFGSPRPTATGTQFGATTTPSTGLFSGASTGSVFGGIQATTQNTVGFGGQQMTPSTGTQFGATSTPSTGLFSGTSTGNVFRGTQATTQNTGFAGQQTTPSTGLFSGSLAPPGQPSGVFTPKLPTSGTGGSTALFSGVAPPSQPSGVLPAKLPTSGTGGSTALFGGVAPPLKPNFGGVAPNTKPDGFSFGAPTQTTQSSTAANVAPTFGSGMSTLGTKPGLNFGAQETGTTAKSRFSFGTSTAPALCGITQGTSQAAGTFGGMAQPVKPTGIPATMAATSGFTLSGTSVATTQAGTTSTGFKLGSTPGTTAQTTGATTAQPTLNAGGKPAAQATSGFTFGTTPVSTQAATQHVQGLALGQSTTGFNFTRQLSGQPKTTAAATPASTTTKPSIVGTNTNLVFAAKVKSTLPGPTPSLTTTTSTTKPAIGLTMPQTSAATTTTGMLACMLFCYSFRCNVMLSKMSIFSVIILRSFLIDRFNFWWYSKWIRSNNFHCIWV